MSGPTDLRENVIDRRKFLTACSAFGGAAFFAPAAVPAVPAAGTERVRLGQTTLSVSRLCQGTAFRKLPRAETPETRAVLERCLDEGINFFDTAEAYGWGESEKLVGAVMRGRREQVVICTKAAPSRPPANDANPNKLRLRESLRLTRDVIANKCDGSLRRLWTDYIDLYLIHSPDEVTPPDELADSMDRLVRAGKVRYWGVSNFNAEDVARFVTLGSSETGSAIAATEDFYNIVGAERRTFMERELMPVIGRANLGLLAFSPLDTGRLAPDAPLKPGHPRHTIAGELDRVAALTGATRPQVCIAWVLARQEVTCCLAGAEMPEHVTDNVPGTRLRLPTDLLERLNVAADEYAREIQRRKSNAAS